MNNWFEVKASYEKTMENGTQKKVTESYLIDALSCTEAEARAIEELKPYISGEFTIGSVRQMKIAELFFNEQGDRYWKAKVQFITLNEKSGTEKRTNVSMLAQATDIENAFAVVKKGMEGTMTDYWIAGMNETTIMDVFPYHAPDKTEN